MAQSRQVADAVSRVTGRPVELVVAVGDAAEAVDGGVADPTTVPAAHLAEPSGRR
jgi:hypothetical protein